MPKPTVERIVEEIRELAPEQRRQVLDKLQNLTSDDILQNGAADIDLTEAMVITAPSRQISAQEYWAWKPVEIKGKPLSETIIEDRR
jgi:hypothetical protein